MIKHWNVGISRTNEAGERETGTASCYAETAGEAVEKIRAYAGPSVEVGTAVEVSPTITWMDNAGE